MFTVWSTLWTEMGEASFLVGRQCFLTNCQSMQEMSAPESTSVEESMTLRVCEGVINCTGICIDLFKVDTSTRAHITGEGELCIEASLPFKNPYPTQRKFKLLHPLHHHLLFLWAPRVSLLFRHAGHKVSWMGQRRWGKQTSYVRFFDNGSRVLSWHIALVLLGWFSWVF